MIEERLFEVPLVDFECGKQFIENGQKIESDHVDLNYCYVNFPFNDDEL